MAMVRGAAIDDAIIQAGVLASPRTSLGRICVVHAVDAVGNRTWLETTLRAQRYAVVPVAVGRSTVAQATTADPDLVIVLLGRARFDVVRLCESLHEAMDCRILIVVEPGCPVDERTVIDVLDAGADDFVFAETGTSVMFARIRVALRASPVRHRSPQQIVVGDILIDLEAHVVLVGGEPVNCPPRQFDLLVALASNAGSMVLRDTLIADVWGIPPASVNPRRVRIAISLLRRLIGTGLQRPRIESVSRIGYRLVAPTPL